MREILTEIGRRSSGGGRFRWTTILIVTLVIMTQVFVVYNVQGKVRAANNQAKTQGGQHQLPRQDRSAASDDSSLASEEAALATMSLDEMVDALPPAELNEFRFRSEVERPAKDMIEKFPKHPEMVLGKLKKFLEKEEKKSQSLLDEVTKVRTVLGMSEPESNEIQQEPNSDGGGFLKRKLQALSYSSALPKCPENPPGLLGPLIVQTEADPSSPEPEVGSEGWRDWYGEVKEGGKFKPEDCEARQKVAIIVPYRDRAEHLDLFLHHMHPVLQRQKLDYQIFIIEQADSQPFNRAALMNIGYREASALGAFTCFIFHDVDLVPEDDRNLYTCPTDTPKHLAVAVNKWKYRLIYDKYFGGVTALSKAQFERINGFSNSFYGWGGEDDDLYHRVVEKAKMKIFRYPGNIARYSMLKHDSVEKSEQLEDLMQKSKNDQLSEDGLSTLHYTLLNSRTKPLYTWYLAKLPNPPKRTAMAGGFWSMAKDSLLQGVSSMAGGVAKNIADNMSDRAKLNEEEHEEGENRVY